MLILCNRILSCPTSWAYEVCCTIYQNSGQSVQGGEFTEAIQLDNYLQLQQSQTLPLLLQFDILQEGAITAIGKPGTTVIYTHGDPRDVLCSYIQTSEHNFELVLALLLQYQPQRWLPLAHRVVWLSAKEIDQNPLKEINRLGESLGLKPFDYSTLPSLLTPNLLNNIDWQQSLTIEEQLLAHALFKPLLLYSKDESAESFAQRFLNLVNKLDWTSWLDLLQRFQKAIWPMLPSQRQVIYTEIEQSLIQSFQDLGLAPQGAEIANYLGNQLSLQGHFAEAKPWYLKAIELQPQLAKLYHNLGFVTEKQQEWETAIPYYHQAITLNPHYTKAYYRLGLVLKQQKIIPKAIECFKQVLNLEPNHPSAKFHLALLWQAQEQEEKAKNVLNAEDWKLLPNLVTHLINRGNRYQEQNKYDDAQACYELALEFKPTEIIALYNLGLIFQKQGKLPEANAYYNQALKQDSEDIPALLNCGLILKEMGYIYDAIPYFQKILQLNPKNLDALKSLASSAEFLGRIPEAVDYAHQVLQIEPTAPNHTYFLWLLSALTLISSEEILDSASQWYFQQIVQECLPTLKDHKRDRSPERKLRIGYVSPDFQHHSCSFFMKPVLGNHDHSQVEIYGYAEVAKPDHITEEIQSFCDHWRSTVGLSDLEVAELIQADQIDILIDLAGHTNGNRLKVFGIKPAPIQATYLGYFATTGLPTIDYWITDAVLHPAETKEVTSEKLWRLPRCYVTYDIFLDAPDVAPLPVEKTGSITFGSFNNPRKLTPQTITLWSEILKAIPNSRLLLKALRHQAVDPRVQEKLMATFIEQGVAKERLFFQGASDEHLKLYNEVDIHLDPFPYSGCTTTCEALWMGVPTLTLAGARNMERLSATLIQSIGLEEWIASSPEEYVQKAIQFSQDRAYLAQLRSTMRDRLQQSQLLDAQGMTTTLEQAYRQMWHLYLEQIRANR